MTKLRILVVDDEPLARERVRSLLSVQPEVEVLGECGSGFEAISAIQRDRPDVVFLDIQMPGCDGLEVVAQLPPDERPAVVFVTAHDRFAVDAFGVRAVDYLLKPFDRERLVKALARATEYIRARRSADLETRIRTLLAQPATAQKPDRLVVRTDGRVVFVKPEEIVWIEAANNYSILHLVDSRRLMIRESISALQERLGSSDFVRISRSSIVRLDQVRELRPNQRGDYVVVLHDGRTLGLSRQLRGRPEIFMPPGA